MNRLEALRAALEAKREAEREWEKHSEGGFAPDQESRIAAYACGSARNALREALTDDTIAALIAVVEAGKRMDAAIVNLQRLDPYSAASLDGAAALSGWDAALAPLVKEER